VRTIFCAPFFDEEISGIANRVNHKRASDSIAWAKSLKSELKIGYLHRHQSRSRATFISIHKFFIHNFPRVMLFCEGKKEALKASGAPEIRFNLNKSSRVAAFAFIVEWRLTKLLWTSRLAFSIESQLASIARSR
jgi:hypothetical protein